MENKKGNIITIVSFKTYLIIIGIVICLFLFLFASNSSKITEKDCPKGIIPDRLDLKYGGNGGLFNEACWSGLEWADGTKLCFFSCYPGKEGGENINLQYCKNVNYWNKPINADGTVSTEVYLKVNLIIDPNNKNELGYKIIDSKCRKMK